MLRRHRLAWYPGRQHGAHSRVVDDDIVDQTYTFPDDDGASVSIGSVAYEGIHDELFVAEMSHELDAPKRVVAQFVERLPQGVRIQIEGVEYDVAVLTPREHTASNLMIPKAEIDTSKSLLSPMPGCSYCCRRAGPGCRAGPRARRY